MPVIRLPIDIPPRMAGMNKLMVLPRRDAATVACNNEFAEVLLMLIERPGKTSKVGNPQNHGLIAASAVIAP
jgi:hypothetical protein